MKILIFLTLFTGIAFAADCPSSSVPTVQQCYLSYFFKYGLKGMPNYQVYITTAQNFINRNGVQGEAMIKDWIATRISCLQPFVPDCVTVEAFKHVFSTNNDTIARQWATTRPIEDWEFTDGYDEMVKNHDCLQSMHNQHNSDIVACANNLSLGFQHGVSCPPVNDYITCMMNAYQKYCGRGSADFICHSTTISMNFNFPQCTDTPKCPGNGRMMNKKNKLMSFLRHRSRFFKNHKKQQIK